METNIYVYNELLSIAQTIINEAANSGNLTEVMNQGSYSMRDMDRAINDKKSFKVSSEVNYAIGKMYSDGGIHMIYLEHGTFKCSLPVSVVFSIGAKFEAMVPAKVRKCIEVRKEADDVVESYAFTVASKHMGKLAKCADNDKLRPILNGVCVDLNAGHIYATNGNILASIAITVDADASDVIDSVHVRRPVFPAAQMAKMKPGTYTIAYLSDGNIRLSGNGVEFCADKELNDKRYPNAEAVMRSFSNHAVCGYASVPKGVSKFFETEKRMRCTCTAIAYGEEFLAVLKTGTSDRVERVFADGSTQGVIVKYAAGECMNRFMSLGIDRLAITDAVNFMYGGFADDADFGVLFVARDDNNNNKELYFSALDKVEEAA